MRVVPAGMHDGDHLPVIVAHFLGSEGQPRRLLDRKRIHVGAERDRATRFAALEDAHDARSRHPCADFQLEAAEVIRDEFRGPRLLVAKFRVLVDVPPQHD